ncbi:MAG TPA: sigma-70 family RNA polymerase sigma factor [Polyangiaceae bacterium]|nr:sigma-70 family RNA polymerase sigma factor [Polyangiaceae bacterium]
MDDTPAPRAESRNFFTFETLYREHVGFVGATAQRLGVQSSALDDLIQEVFLVVHRKWGTMEKPQCLRSWLYGIVRRKASNHRRSKDESVSLYGDAADHAEVRASTQTPLEQAERNASVQLLIQLLNGLDEAKREVFALVDIEELSVPEAAAALQIPLNTAYSRLRVARQQFGAAVARHEARAKFT